MSNSINRLRKLARELNGVLEETVTRGVSDEIIKMPDNKKKELIYDAAEEAIFGADEPDELFSLSRDFFHVPEATLDALSEETNEKLIGILSDKSIKILDLLLIWEEATGKQGKAGLDEEDWEKYRKSLISESEEALKNSKGYEDFMENGPWAVIFRSLKQPGLLTNPIVALRKKLLKEIEEVIEGLSETALVVMAEAASGGLGRVVEQPGLLKSLVQKLKGLF